MKSACVILASLFLGACGAVQAEEVGDKSTTPVKDPTPAAQPAGVDECPGGDDDVDGFCKKVPGGKKLDCDDTDLKIHPSVEDDVVKEICDGKDNDCNGQTDEGFTTSKFYRDEDGDGYGAASNYKEMCGEKPPEGYVTKSGDCNDADPKTNPGEKDPSLNGLDENCDDHVPAASEPVPESSNDENDPAAKSGSLTVSTTKSDRLELTYHLFASYGEIGKGWDIDEPFVADWSDTVTASIPDVSKACGVRIGLTIGGGSTKSWGCQDGEVNELIKSVDLTLGDKVTHNVAPKVWLDEENGGCGLYVTWEEACDAP